jgi:hypothetical protein
MNNLRTALRAAGADLDNVLKTTVYVATQRQEDLLAAWEVVKRHFGSHDAPTPCSEPAHSATATNSSKSRQWQLSPNQTRPPPASDSSVEAAPTKATRCPFKSLDVVARRPILRRACRSGGGANSDVVLRTDRLEPRRSLPGTRARDDESLPVQARLRSAEQTSGLLGRASLLPGIPATSGSRRGFAADTRAGSVRDACKAGGRASTKRANLQALLRERRDSNPRPPA